MYNYSVIIPHYNTPRLLDRCLNSIPQRSDIQVVIVDDNSSEEIVDFSNFPGRNRPDVEIIYNKNGGSAGRARNLGLNLAKGRWILFADADDFFTSEAFACFDEYLDSINDIVYFDTLSVDTDTLCPSQRNRIYNIFISNCDNVDESKFNQIRCGHSVPYAKMIKRRLVEMYKIGFDETRYCNDTVFSLLTGIYAERIYVDHRVVYCVTSREGSLTTQMSLEALLIRMDVILRANKIMRKNKLPKYQNSLLSYFNVAYKIGFYALFKAIKLTLRYNGFNIYTMCLSSLRIRKLYKGMP